MRAPAKLVVLRWQLSQAALVTMWVAGLPRAVVPLWQEAQLPVTPVWSQRTETNEKVLRWQLSQGAAVSICVAGLARACEPLWQAAQAPMIWL